MAFAWAADGTRLHYEVLGRPGAEPLLMIQGLGADMSGWTLQRLAFSPRYRTIALDNRGAGRSDKPFGRYSLEEMADDAVAVLDARRRRAGPRDGRVDGRRHRPARGRSATPSGSSRWSWPARRAATTSGDGSCSASGPPSPTSGAWARWPSGRRTG